MPLFFCSALNHSCNKIKNIERIAEVCVGSGQGQGWGKTGLWSSPTISSPVLFTQLHPLSKTHFLSLFGGAVLHVKCEPGDLHEPGENNVGNKKTWVGFLTVLKTAVEQSALPGRNYSLLWVCWGCRGGDRWVLVPWPCALGNRHHCSTSAQFSVKGAFWVFSRNSLPQSQEAVKSLEHNFRPFVWMVSKWGNSNLSCSFSLCLWKWRGKKFRAVPPKFLHWLDSQHTFNTSQRDTKWTDSCSLPAGTEIGNTAGCAGWAGSCPQCPGWNNLGALGCSPNI